MTHKEDGLRDFTTDRSVIRLSLLSILIGCVSALVAWVLIWLIAVITNLCYFGRISSNPNVTPGQSHLGVWSIFIPAIGGLIIGFMARYGSEKIRGHGIPEALEAILIGRSKIEAKVAILKPLSSAISIGTGGPYGAEGPIIMTGGALGSLFAQFFNLSAAERKTLLVAGAAGGMSAIFSAPVAGVLLAVELLLFEWKPRSFVPVAFASIAAAALRVPLLGQGPIFPVTPHVALNIPELCIAIGVGLLAGLGSGILTTMVYGFEDLFPKLKLHWMWWPAIGGVFVGIGGLIDPRVLGVGYGVIHGLIDNKIVGVTLISLVLVKGIVWSLSLGSGTSGGVLAPLLMIGGALGALVGQCIPYGTPGLWAMIGMAAMMGGTMGSPFTAAVFTLELTHDINVFPALMIACIASELVTVLWMKRSILTEKVARRGHHLIREYIVDPFEIHRVREVMITSYSSVDPQVPVTTLTSPSFPGAAWFAHRHALPIIDSSDRLLGIVTHSDVLKALEEHNLADCPVIDIGTTQLIVVREDEVLREAVVMMLSNNIGRLPVVSAEDPHRMVGYLDRSSVMKARMRWYEEEHVLEKNFSMKTPILSVFSLFKD